MEGEKRKAAMKLGAQFLTALEVAKEYAQWRKYPHPHGIEIDPKLKEAVDALGMNDNEALKNYFAIALARAQAALDAGEPGTQGEEGETGEE